jgi:hypothetical protein
VEAVRREFAFLERFGYYIIGAEPTLVTYSNGATRIAVFHGRGSYVVGVDFSPSEIETYSLKELLIVTRGKEAAIELIAETAEAVVSAVQAVAEQTRGLAACLDGNFPVDDVARYRQKLTDYYERKTDIAP